MTFRSIDSKYKRGQTISSARRSIVTCTGKQTSFQLKSIMPCYRSSTPDHSSYSLVNQGPPERYLRKYAARKYKENIESFIPRGGFNQANLKLGMKSIYSRRKKCYKQLQHQSYYCKLATSN